MDHTLFVYGTLRKGFCNHPLMNGARCLGPATTQEAFALFCQDIPYLCKEPRQSVVRGEVYVVDDAQLERIDGLERHPQWYEREEIAVLLDSGQELTAWCYFNDEPLGSLLETGDYADLRKAKRLMHRRQSRT